MARIRSRKGALVSTAQKKQETGKPLTVAQKRALEIHQQRVLSEYFKRSAKEKEAPIDKKTLGVTKQVLRQKLLNRGLPEKATDIVLNSKSTKDAIKSIKNRRGLEQLEGALSTDVSRADRYYSKREKSIEDVRFSPKLREVRVAEYRREISGPKDKALGILKRSMQELPLSGPPGSHSMRWVAIQAYEQGLKEQEFLNALDKYSGLERYKNDPPNSPSYRMRKKWHKHASTAFGYARRHKRRKV